MILMLNNKYFLNRFTNKYSFTNFYMVIILIIISLIYWTGLFYGYYIGSKNGAIYVKTN